MKDTTIIFISFVVSLILTYILAEYFVTRQNRIDEKVYNILKDQQELMDSLRLDIAKKLIDTSERYPNREWIEVIVIDGALFYEENGELLTAAVVDGDIYQFDKNGNVIKTEKK